MGLRFIFTLISLFAVHSAFADDYYNRPFRFDKNQDFYTPAVAGSVSAPSDQALYGENPAGLIYNNQIKLMGFFGSTKDYGNSLSNGLSLFTGNGLAAATIGAQTVSNVTDQNGSITLVNFGVATYAETLNLAVGLNGNYRFSGKAGVDEAGAGNVPTWTSNVGLLFNPKGSAHLGLTFYDLSHGVTAVGTGGAIYLNPSSIVALDASTDNHGKGLTVKPGVAVLADSLSLSYGYGMQVDKSTTSAISAGNTIGLGYQFNSQFKLQGYFNQVTPWFLGGTVAF